MTLTRRFLVAGAICLSVVALPSPIVSAAPSDPDDGTFERTGRKTDTETGETPGEETEGGDETPVKIACRWSDTPTHEIVVRVLNVIDDILDRLPTILGGTSTEFDVEYFIIDGDLERWNDETARFEARQDANCAGATLLTAEERLGSRWVVSVPPEAWIMRDDVLLVVSGRIPVPTPEISPGTSAPVNLGLWLAVADAGPIVAEGSLGPLWLRGTATLDSTTFDMGNGDRVVCDAGGTPIVDPDMVEQGPCGYTYRTLADVDADLTITMTTRWEITWETSDGSSAGEPPEVISLTSTLPYDVYEIQTVGTGD